MPRKPEVQNSPQHILPGAHPSLSVHKPHQLLKITLLCVASCPGDGVHTPKASGSAQQLDRCPKGTRDLESGSGN